MPSEGGIDSSWKDFSDQHQERLFQKHNDFVTEQICLTFSHARACNGAHLGAPFAQNTLFYLIYMSMVLFKVFMQERFWIWWSCRCDYFNDFNTLKLHWPNLLFSNLIKACLYFVFFYFFTFWTHLDIWRHNYITIYWMIVFLERNKYRHSYNLFPT